MKRKMWYCTISKCDIPLLVSQQKKVQEARLSSLEKRVSQNKANPQLVQELENLKALLTNKKNLHTQLTDSSTTYAAGFSMAMTELSQLHHRDISLQQVKMNNTFMTFAGIARKPEAVPKWLAAFEQSTFLAGESFTHFSLSENEDSSTQFVVSSSASPKFKGE